MHYLKALLDINLYNIDSKQSISSILIEYKKFWDSEFPRLGEGVINTNNLKHERSESNNTDPSYPFDNILGYYTWKRMNASSNRDVNDVKVSLMLLSIMSFSSNIPQVYESIYEEIDRYHGIVDTFPDIRSWTLKWLLTQQPVKLAHEVELNQLFEI